MKHSVYLILFALILTACGGGTTEELLTPQTSPVATDPNIKFSSDLSTITSGGKVRLMWSSENTTTCIASGAWSGTKTTSGEENVTVSNDSTFILTCEGDGTSVQKSVVVSVTSATPSETIPVVELSSNLSTVSSGGSVRLTWSSENATTCTASGDWSGTKATSGEEVISGLVSDAATVSATTPGEYVWKSLTAGAEVYIDRSYTYTSIPSSYDGLQVLATANSDKISTSNAFISFEVDKAITVYVAHVDGGANLPDWLSSWTSTGDEISTSDRTFFVYKKEFSAGTVTLGGNNNAPSMYTVFVASPDTGVTGSTAVFNLSCDGDGLSDMKSVTVTIIRTPVTTPPVTGVSPVVQLSSDFDMIRSGDSVRLTWVSENTTTCSASGTWSGLKSTNGEEVISGLTTDSTFILTCEGGGKTITKSIVVSVISSSDVVSGRIDSSYISRISQNAVYVYSGSVIPDDRDGDSGDPLLVVPVVAIDNSCGWKYAVSGLAAGDYTFAFTSEASNDDPVADDVITFGKVLNLNVSGTGQVLNFDANKIIKVGPGRTYTKPSEAYAVASSGDVIEIDAGLYLDDIVVWRQNNLTLRGVGGRAHLKATKLIEYVGGSDSKNGKGIWVTRGRNIKVENMEFSGSTVDGNNGAGIRMDGRDISICNSYFHDNQNGVLGGDAGYVLIEYSEFANNGYQDGRAHNMYISSADKFILKNSYTHHAKTGHNVKTRAKENHILYNRVMDEDSGTASYAIDVPNGGKTYIIGNLVQQGANTGNSTMISYGAEGLNSGRSHELYIINNTLVNDRSSGTFVYVRSGTSSAVLTNNILLGNGNSVSGTADMVSNHITTDSSVLVNRGNFDYHPTNNSSVVDAGTDPGSASGFSLTPSYQYVYDQQTEIRRKVGAAMDIGAYEYNN